MSWEWAALPKMSLKHPSKQGWTQDRIWQDPPGEQEVYEPPGGNQDTEVSPVKAEIMSPPLRAEPSHLSSQEMFTYALDHAPHTMLRIDIVVSASGPGSLTQINPKTTRLAVMYPTHLVATGLRTSASSPSSPELVTPDMLLDMDSLLDPWKPSSNGGVQICVGIFLVSLLYIHLFSFMFRVYM